MRVSLRGVLTDPRVYVAYQKLMGTRRCRYLCLEEAGLKPGERVLDVGCGPAYYLDRLPDVDYVGFDTCEAYIAYARRHNQGRRDFRCEFLTAQSLAELGKFDAVVLFGLLHHIDDAQCASLLDLCAQSLAPGGRVISADPTLHAGQRRVSRWMVEHDRGGYVRQPEDYGDMARSHFGRVEARLDDTHTRIPIAQCMMRMSEPLGHAASPARMESHGWEAGRR
jgi:SAM-dependent methyltransferase